MCCSRNVLLFLLGPILFLVAARLYLKSSAHARLSIAVGLMGWDGVGNLAKETFAQRWLGQKQTASRVEFIGLLDALMEADEKYLSPTGRAVVDKDDIAEGHVYLSHLLRTGFITMLENDATRPSFTKLVRLLLCNHSVSLIFPICFSVHCLSTNSRSCPTKMACFAVMFLDAVLRPFLLSLRL